MKLFNDHNDADANATNEQLNLMNY